MNNIGEELESLQNNKCECVYILYVCNGESRGAFETNSLPTFPMWRSSTILLY